MTNLTDMKPSDHMEIELVGSLEIKKGGEEIVENFQ
ncbi:MAG: hypothetical protein ACI8ZB_000293 [Desulforhopalus sp.]|jgi:hypothetical protein